MSRKSILTKEQTIKKAKNTKLTENARWIFVLLETIPEDDFIKSYNILMSCGRHSWNEPEMKVIYETINFRDNWNRQQIRLLQTFVVDVDLIKYSKDWGKAYNFAKKYFAKRGLLCLS